MLQSYNKREDRIVGYDEIKIRCAIRKALLSLNNKELSFLGDHKVSVGAIRTGKRNISVIFSGNGIIDIIDLNLTKEFSSCTSNDICSYCYLPKKKIHVDRSTDEMSAERMSRTIDELLCYEYEAEINPQSKYSHDSEYLHRSDETKKGDGGFGRYGAEGYGGSSQGANSHRVGVTNRIKRGKEHGLPDSSGLTNMAAVPPNIPVWRVLSDILLDRMFEKINGEITAQIAEKSSLRREISFGKNFHHEVNGVSVIYTENGYFYVKHYPGCLTSTSSITKSMTKEMAGLIIFEIDEDEEYRKIIEKMNPSAYSNYKNLVEDLMNENYKNNPEFDDIEIQYLDSVKQRVVEIAKWL